MTLDSANIDLAGAHEIINQLRLAQSPRNDDTAICCPVSRALGQARRSNSSGGAIDTGDPAKIMGEVLRNPLDALPVGVVDNDPHCRALVAEEEAPRGVVECNCCVLAERDDNVSSERAESRKAAKRAISIGPQAAAEEVIR